MVYYILYMQYCVYITSGPCAQAHTIRSGICIEEGGWGWDGDEGEGEDKLKEHSVDKSLLFTTSTTHTTHKLPTQQDWIQ